VEGLLTVQADNFSHGGQTTVAGGVWEEEMLLGNSDDTFEERDSRLGK
jgi:hypothetical protein